MTRGQRVLAISCGFEAATGLGLLVAPAVVAKLLLGDEIAGAAITVGNVTGVALISLAVACWPREKATVGAAYVAMLTYNLLSALLLAEVGVSATANGIMLWPAVVYHLVFTILIALASISYRRGATNQA